MGAMDQSLCLLVHWSTKNWKLDSGDKAMDSEYGDSFEVGTLVFPLLKNVKKHLKRVKKGLKQMKLALDESNPHKLTASLGQLRSILLEARTQLLETYANQKVQAGVIKEGKDYKSKRKELEKNRSYKRILRMSLRFILWWWKATLFCATLFCGLAGLLYWGRKTSIFPRLRDSFRSLRRYLYWPGSSRDAPRDEGIKNSLFKAKPVASMESSRRTRAEVVGMGRAAILLDIGRSSGLFDWLFSLVSMRTLVKLFLGCLLLGLAFASWKVGVRITGKKKKEVIRFMKEVEEKLRIEREREALKEKVEIRREEKEELQKFPDELLMKIANRMWEVMMENVEKLSTCCNELGTEHILNQLVSSVPGMPFVYNGIAYPYDVDARTNFELHFENCKNHIRGVISSYENLLETINFRKQQHKIARQLSRFGRTNSALDGDSWNPDDGKKKASPVSNEEQNQMDTAESGFGFGFGSSSSSSFGSGFFGFGGPREKRTDPELSVGIYESRANEESDDEEDEENQRKNWRDRADGRVRYGPSGEVLDDYETFDYDGSDRDLTDEEDSGGRHYSGASVYGNFDEVADIYRNYEHMD